MSQSNTSLTAHRSRRAVSTLHEWTRYEDVSDRLFNPRFTSTSLLGTTTGAENSMAREWPGQPIPTESVMSLLVTYPPSSRSGAGGKKWRRQSSRSSESEAPISANETFLPFDSSSLLSWTTASTAPTMSELEHVEPNPIQGVLQLIPNGHAIEPTTIPPPTFSCRFWFLNCAYTSSNEIEWKEHNLSHFRGHVPPQSNTCPLCDMTFNIPDPNVSWAASMSHLAQHFKDGETMSTTRPEFALFRHLWAKRIISDVDYQELTSTSRPKYGRRQYVVSERGRNRREQRGYSTPQSRM